MERGRLRHGCPGRGVDASITDWHAVDNWSIFDDMQRKSTKDIRQQEIITQNK